MFWCSWKVVWQILRLHIFRWHHNINHWLAGGPGTLNHHIRLILVHGNSLLDLFKWGVAWFFSTTETWKSPSRHHEITKLNENITSLNCLWSHQLMIVSPSQSKVASKSLSCQQLNHCGLTTLPRHTSHRSQGNLVVRYQMRWSNMTSDHSRPVDYPKWWLIVREFVQTCPKNSGLGMTKICAAILMDVTSWYTNDRAESCLTNWRFYQHDIITWLGPSFYNES